MIAFLLHSSYSLLMALLLENFGYTANDLLRNVDRIHK